MVICSSSTVSAIVLKAEARAKPSALKTLPRGGELPEVAKLTREEGFRRPATPQPYPPPHSLDTFMAMLGGVIPASRQLFRPADSVSSSLVPSSCSALALSP